MQNHLPFSVILGKVAEDEERCLFRRESGDSGRIIKSWTAVKPNITEKGRKVIRQMIMIFTHRR